MATTVSIENRPYVLDLRSLAAFRILLGLYLLYDIYSRLSLGKYDLYWYISDGFLDVDDTCHQAPLHRVWFYRGSASFQIAYFSLLTILVACFCLGFYCNGLFKTVFWVTHVALENRNMFVADGSDAYVRHLLFWSIFLPLSECWSLDARKRQVQYKTTISGLPCLSLTLQMVLMYYGTFFHRTTDLYSIQNLKWLPPKLTAVHYALSGSFSTRDYWLTRFIRTNVVISKSMTLMAMTLEFLAPLGCMVDGRRRHWYAFVLFQLHLGLYLTMNLPNWQFLGMLTQVVWIPTHAWDTWLQRDETAIYKKTDGDVVSRHRSHPVARIFQAFWFGYMIYNWLGQRGWIPKHDRGDIGESLRLSQNWFMFGRVGHVTHTMQLTGVVDDDDVESVRLDLFHYLKSGGQERKQDAADYVPHDMTHRYPSPRWERALYQWAGENSTIRARRLAEKLCVLINQDRQEESPIREIEVRWPYVRVLPPGSGTRYDVDDDILKDSRLNDTVVTVHCDAKQEVN